jgi:RimJ/RimL family protein N-acetyltransferase
MGPGIERLETQRLVLRRFAEADREPFATLNADPEVTRHLSGPMTRAESDAGVERLDAHWARHGYGLYAVEAAVHRGSGPMFVGFVGIQHHRALPEDVEIGWRLARSAWGLGFATEAAVAVRDLAFEVIGLPRLVSITTDENLASRRVMDKLGFRYDRHLRFEQWNLRVALLEAPSEGRTAEGPRSPD